MYDITEYTRNRLKQLNKKLNTEKITINQSKNKDKKIDVFINNKKVASIIMGILKWICRKLYYRRHSREDDIKDGKITPSWWARWLLW